MKLAKGGPFFRAMGTAVDDSAAHSTDSFPAVMIECNGIFTVQSKLFIDNVDHL
jgi:hypothetical protein